VAVLVSGRHAHVGPVVHHVPGLNSVAAPDEDPCRPTPALRRSCRQRAHPPMDRRPSGHRQPGLPRAPCGRGVSRGAWLWARHLRLCSWAL